MSKAMLHAKEVLNHISYEATTYYENLEDFIISEENRNNINSHTLSCIQDDIENWFQNHLINNMSIDKISLPKIPRTVQEAINPNNPHCEEWWDSIVKELQNIDDFETFKDTNTTGRAASTTMVFRASYDNDMNLKFKSRLVFRGFTQIYGIDYEQTYAPTVPIVVVFILLFLGGHLNLYDAIFDVTAAFLESYNDFEQYCLLPKGLFSPDFNRRKLVHKGLYGQKQSPWLWYILLSSILINKMNFFRCPDCYCLYFYYNPITGNQD